MSANKVRTSVGARSDAETKGHRSSRANRSKDWTATGAIIAVVIAAAVAPAVGKSMRHDEITSASAAALRVSDSEDLAYKRAVALLNNYPVIDGHNDLAWQIRVYFKNQLGRVNLTRNTSGADPAIYGNEWQTDIPRLRAGRMGAQFWSAWMTCASQFKDATRGFIDQIDTIKRFVQQYSDTFMFSTTAADIEKAAETGQIASLIGVEGGHAIDSSLATLRQLYDLGARYMTLTHFCDTLWAHSSNDSRPLGLTDFGGDVVREMNRLGMMVDISHVNNYTMMDTLDTTFAPVIFSHSSAYALCNNPRNVPDNVLKRMPQNGGIVMVNFYPLYINCSPNATVGQVADHIDHIQKVAGIDYVGLGSDFDGIDVVPVGLEDVSKYPNLFAELIRRGYSDSDLQKIARGNLIRVFKAVEGVRDKLKDVSPDNTLISPEPTNITCRPDF